MQIYEYIWLDKDGGLRSKTRVIDQLNINNQIPDWEYDGSSTKQAVIQQSEVQLIPVCSCPDPFRNGGLLVLCQTEHRGAPADGEYRYLLNNIDYEQNNCWFGVEQEYFLFNTFNENKESIDSYNGNYCTQWGQKRTYRMIAEMHLENCMKAGIRICGYNSEVAENQWEYQIGPLFGDQNCIRPIDIADQLIMSRYILERTAEQFGYSVCWFPKPFPNSAGSGCHVNFSDKFTRDQSNGYNTIIQYLSQVSTHHDHNVRRWGTNQDRLTGDHETSLYDTFSFGVGSRGVSCRISYKVAQQGYGYFENRIPASDMNPYVVFSDMLQQIYTPNQ